MPFFFPRYALTQSIVWDKDMLGIGGCYRKQTEFVIYARTSGAPAMPKDRRDLIRLRPAYASKQHPAEKPLALVHHLAAATNWATLLDPYAGTGTALVAAQRLGRRAIGIEIEERYCEIAAQRLSQGVLPLSLATGD
jgi:site-specific DNA-methyltransferase (adenine-specific)